MPAAPAAPSGGAAKTMFGYAAPVLKPAAPGGPPPAAPPPAAPPSAPPAAAPPKPGATMMGTGGMIPPGAAGGPPPGAPPGFGPPPSAPPPGAPPGFGAPPPGAGFGAPPPGAPPGAYGGPPPGAPPGGFGGPGPVPGGAPPGFGAPPPGAPAPYGGAPAMNAPMGAPPPMGGAPAMSAPPGAPPAYDPFAAPQQDLPGPLDDLARRLPQSKPGTLFGIPLSTLRDVSVQKSLMLIAGIALIAAVFVPWQLSPTEFSWDQRDPSDGGKMIFSQVVWPLLAGAVYLLLTAAPADMRKNIPPIVLQWLPFGVAILGIIITRAGGFTTFAGSVITLQAKGDRDAMLAARDMWDMLWLYSFGYALLCFGLLARLAQPQDQIARIVIGAGVVCTLLMFFNSFGVFFSFKAGALFGIHNLLFFVVSLLCLACVAFVIPAHKVPALAAVDALAPAMTAVLLVWVVVQPVILLLANLVHGDTKFLTNILIFAHLLLPVVAFFGVLMVTAPAAYDELKAQLGKRGMGGPQPPGGYGPGGGYPPGGPGGYPPPGGGYPPQGGGFPPQGGGFPPPQGGGFPPPQGGGFPPPAGGGGYPPPGGGYPGQ